MYIERNDYSIRRAQSYDLNGDGIVSSRELPRTPEAKRLLDRNLDGHVSVLELADGFRSGEVKVQDGKLMASYENEYRPLPPRPIYPQQPYYNRHDDVVGGAVAGGLLGAMTGALLGGRDGAAAGAIIGGTLGAASGLDH